MPKVTVGELVYKVVGDVDGFSSTMAKADKQVKDVGTTMEKSTGSVGKLTQGFSALKLAVAGAATYLAFKFKQALTASIKDASDLNESVNAVNVVFGSGSAKILEFGKNSATSVGLAKAEFYQLATVSGALLKDTGLSMEEVADQTTMLAQRAADMASVFNTDVQDALFAINAAIRGETESIRRFAGDVTDASLQAYLLSKGIKTSVSALTEQEKRLYRVQLIMKQTDVTAGDFANTSDGLANRQRILAAQTTNLSARLGGVLLPTIESLVGQLSLASLESEEAEAKFQALTKGIYQGTNYVIAMAKAFVLIVQAMTATADVMWSLKKVVTTFGKEASMSIVNVKDNFLTLVEGIGQAVSGDFSGALDTFKKSFSEAFTETSAARDELLTKTEVWSGMLTEQFESVGESAVRAIDAEGFTPVTLSAVDGLRKIQNEADATAGNLDKNAEKMAAASDNFKEKLIGVLDKVKEMKEGLGEELTESIKKFGDAVAEAFDNQELAEVFLNAQDQLKALKKELADSEDSEDQSRIRKEIKAQQEILASRKGFEERQAATISEIRQRLTDAGIDIEKEGIDKLLTVKSLEDRIVEERALRDLDEFARAEELQKRKLIAAADALIAEIDLIRSKNEQQAALEADLTTFLTTQNLIRKEDVDQFATFAIAKYGEIAASLREAVSLQSRLNALRDNPKGKPQFHNGGFVDGRGGDVHPGEYVIPAGMVSRFGSLISSIESARTSGHIDNSKSINAPITIHAPGADQLDFRAIGREIAWDLERK